MWDVVLDAGRMQLAKVKAVNNKAVMGTKQAVVL
jgi:hypothetical protein